MSLYEGIKDVAQVLQKIDNIDVYKKLIDLSAQALEMQNEIIQLKEEIRTLKLKGDISSKITRHKSGGYLTLKDDEEGIMYCSACWDANSKTIQVHISEDEGTYLCPTCNAKGIYDKRKFDEYKENFAFVCNGIERS